MKVAVFSSEDSSQFQSSPHLSADVIGAFIVRFGISCFLICLTMALPRQALSQAPPILWSANVNARLFAVDNQANAYATTSGQVIRISDSGVPLWTNSICPSNSVQTSLRLAYVSPRVAGLDSSGNFYFAGDFDGTQDFGGITLVGGWTNNYPHPWTPGWPTCFLAKYSGIGSLQWVVSFGQQAAECRMHD